MCGCSHELSVDYVFALSCMSWYWYQCAAITLQDRRIVTNARWGRPQGEEVSHMWTRERGSEYRYFCGRPLGMTFCEGVILLSCSEGKRNDDHTLYWSVDRRVQRVQKPGALRVVQQIKKIGRTKAMTQSEIPCWIGANRAYSAYSWRHGQLWRLLLVRGLNLFHTASHFWVI